MQQGYLQRAQQEAERVVHTLPWGHVVWHVWRSPQTALAKNTAEPPVHGGPLVLLHGGSGSWTHWVNNVVHLSQTREVWALDIPGFGDSDVPSEVRDADDLVPLLRALLAHAFPDQTVDVVAFSFGGLTAGLLAAQPPHNMRRLVLVGVPGLGLMQETLPMRGMLPEMTVQQQRAVHRHNLKTIMLQHDSRITEAVIDLQAANVARDRMRRRRIARTDVLARAQVHWQLPVYGIWGENDALYTGQMDRITEKLPRLQSLTRIPDAGHWVMFEQPDAFHEALTRALSNPLPAV